MAAAMEVVAMAEGPVVAAMEAEGTGVVMEVAAREAATEEQ